MKKKSLNVKKRILNNLAQYSLIKHKYKIFESNMDTYLEKGNIAAAVSGGPDSLSLAYFLKCYSVIRKRRAFFYHIDHGLRKESGLEAKIICKKMIKYDINCKILSWKGIKPQSNLQAIARSKRYSLLEQKCIKDKVNNLLIAHHIDDLKENFFIRMTRGAGLEGLVSFNSIKTRLSKNLNIIRPLINIPKKDLVYTSNKVFQFYLNDPSNYEDKFKRSRLRRLINELQAEGLDLNKILLTINNLSQSNIAINYFVELNIKNNVTMLNRGNRYILSHDFFNNPQEIIFRSFNQILRKVGGKFYSPRGISISRMMKNLSSQNFKKTSLGGCLIEKINKSVIIYKERS